MNTINFLPTDIMSMILKMRTEEMKNDKYKKDYDYVISSFKDAVRDMKDDFLCNQYGHYEIYEVSSSEELDNLSNEEKINQLNDWELHDLPYGFLAQVDDDEPQFRSEDDGHNSNCLNSFID
tara:strand:+ start:4900 stop:5265 length:366 start_codon:yes stop_codon:yes gene_type:complete